MKKFLSAVLAGAMVASMASFSAFAAVGDDVGALKFSAKSTHVSGASVTPDKTVKLYMDASSVGVNVDKDAEITATNAQLGNKDLFNFKVKKVEGSKIIKSVALKEDSSNGYFIEIKFKEDMTSDEFKVELDFTFSSKSKAGEVEELKISDNAATDPKLVPLPTGTKLTNTFKLWVSNKERSETDLEQAAGTKGEIAKPAKNEENEVLWTGEYGDIAKLTFDTDSDVKAYYPKLSTKWDSALVGQFADQDAFFYSFVGNPTIPSTARPVLTIFNPFVNEDEELTVDEENIVVYEVVDGELVDVTAKFTIGEDEDSNYVLTAKTRTLGTYIVAEKAVADEAAEEAPAEEGKTVPDTGR